MTLLEFHELIGMGDYFVELTPKEFYELTQYLANAPVPNGPNEWSIPVQIRVKVSD